MPNVRFAVHYAAATGGAGRRPQSTAELLRTLLEPHFDVVALVEDGRALVSVAAQLTPDVIVADISMPILDGIEATARIRRGDQSRGLSS